MWKLLGFGNSHAASLKCGNPVRGFNGIPDCEAFGKITPRRATQQREFVGSCNRSINLLVAGTGPSRVKNQSIFSAAPFCGRILCVKI